MAEIVDIISLPLGLGPKFTVDTTGPLYVEAVPNVAVVALQNGQGFTKFQAGDSLVCLSLGITLPENFVMRNMGAVGSTIFYPVLAVGGLDTVTAVPFIVPLFGGNGNIEIPMSDFEFTVNGFFNAAAVVHPWQLICQFPSAGLNKMRISMVNVPAALNTTVEEIGVFLKILHTLPMVV